MTNKPKIELVGRQWTQKSTLFGQIEFRVLSILGGRKSRFLFVFWKNQEFFFFFKMCGAIWVNDFIFFKSQKIQK